MALPGNDTFTVGSDTQLQNHTSDSGHDWTEEFEPSSNLYCEASTDECTNDGGGNTHAQWNVGPSTADYYVEANVKLGGTGTGLRCRVWARSTNIPSSSETGYEAAMAGNGNWNLNEVTAGARSSIDSASLSISSTTYYDERLTCNGTTISATWDGADELSGTDSTHAGAGEPGIYLGANSLNRMTSITAQALAAPAAAGSVATTFSDQSSMIGIGRLYGRG